MRAFLLLATICHLSQAAPQFLYHPLTYAVPSAAVVTGNSVPVSVGGYKAVAGSNGDLAGPVHVVPGLRTGTGAVVPGYGDPVHYGKRSANPQWCACRSCC